MKIITTFILSLFAITSILAQTYTKDKDYKLSKDEKTLERWLGNQTDVDMKSDPILNKVKHIGKGAFAKHDKGDTPPNNHLGYKENKILKGITFPEKLESIGDFAFINCETLSGDLKLPASLTKIGEQAFYNCTGFNGTLTIGNSVTEIGKGAFADCYNFTGSLTIPDKVEKIGDGAFYRCKGFNSTLTIGSSVTEIGELAFEGCKNFTGSLIIPDKVVKIGDQAFWKCTNFTGSLTIPDKVVEIGASAFMDCTGFNGTLTIGSSVTEIGNQAFLGCIGFDGSLIIPEKVEKIGYRTFNDCKGFTGTLTIGSSVKEIHPNAFKDCNFTSITSLAAVPPKTDFTDIGYPPDLNNPSLNTSLKLFVPKDSEQDYKKHEYWKQFNIEANTAGIKDFKSASIDLRFYPSPVDNVLNIDCESGIQEYTLYNMAGKLLANRSLAKDTVSCEVDMSQLEAGMYLIHIKTKAGQTTFKVMKK